MFLWSLPDALCEESLSKHFVSLFIEKWVQEQFSQCIGAKHDFSPVYSLHHSMKVYACKSG